MEEEFLAECKGFIDVIKDLCNEVVALLDCKTEAELAGALEGRSLVDVRRCVVFNFRAVAVGATAARAPANRRENTLGDHAEKGVCARNSLPSVKGADELEHLKNGARLGRGACRVKEFLERRVALLGDRLEDVENRRKERFVGVGQECYE